MKINMIVACSSNNGIGFQNSIPWFIKSDLKYFSKLTKGNGNNAIVMGRKTWDSLPLKPLPKRENIIITNSIIETTKKIECLKENINVLKSPEIAYQFCKDLQYDEMWIIGGSTIYEYFFKKLNSEIYKIYITKVLKDYECDVFLPDITTNFKITNSIKKTEYEENSKENIEVEYQVLERK